jgi:hypothetical protein
VAMTSANHPDPVETRIIELAEEQQILPCNRGGSSFFLPSMPMPAL